MVGASAASLGDVTINELMYHPAGSEAAEFVELYNPGAADVDLGGWCFEGIEFCFPPGSAIGPGGFRVLARDAAEFDAAYGFVPDFVYLGALDNSGERLVLRDGFLGEVDAVQYGTVPPWPVTPDGLGPSLELIDPAADHASPRNWRAAINGAAHTAGGPNSVAAAALPPWITDVLHTNDAQPGQPIAVTATVLDATNVEFFYVIDFGNEVSLAMMDDGAGGDGAAGDGVFGASIPGQPAGTLVRYRIRAGGPSGTAHFPRTDDTVLYDGTAVIDPLLTSALPIFHWFMDPADFDQAIDHKDTDELEPAVFFYDGVLYDNVQVRVRGRRAREWPKNHWKFILPQGHEFYDPGLIHNPVDNFNLQGHYADKTYLRESLSWETARAAGAPWCQTFHVRLEQNGEFFGLYSFLEDPDRDWVVRHGLDLNAARYKAFDDLSQPSNANELEEDYEKQSRLNEDHSDLFAFVSAIADLSGQARRNWLFDNVDLPTTINYLAVIVLVHDNDHIKKNYFVYRDTEGTGRWTLHLWDKDLTFGRNFNGLVLNDELWADVDVIEGLPDISPSHPLFGDRHHMKYDGLWNRFIDALHDTPEIREMFFRRLRTLADTLLEPGRFEARIDELVPLISAEAEQDRLVWGQYGQTQTLAQAVGALKHDYLDRRRIHLLETHRVPGEVPEASSLAPVVVISEIMFQPANVGEPEFVELFNPSPSESVDLSGWRLDGVAHSLPAGTVLLPQQYLVVVDDDAAFREKYGSGRFVAAEFGGGLDDQGERVALRDRDDRLVARVDYAGTAPWPSAAAGGGASLELIDPAHPNGWVANWAASDVSGGTPGAPNSVAGVIADFPALFVNEVLPQNDSVVTDELDEHEPWIEIYNASTTSVDLGGLFLTDDHANPALWTIPGGTTLCGGCWTLFWADGEPGEGPAHTSFTLSASGGTVGLYDVTGTAVDYLDYGALPGDVSYGRFPDGGADLRVFRHATPRAANDPTLLPMIVNEYNAVSPGQLLDNNASDVFWGAIPGNGGDWFELVVTQDHLDARGWQLDVTNDAGSPAETTTTLVLTDDPLWSDLRSGTLITVSEELDSDASFDPSTGDWWINVQAGVGGDGALISASDFTTSNVNTQVTLRDAAGEVVFGPVGEGIHPPSGVGSDEVFKLEQDPGPFVTPLSDYNDGTSSTFGAPNVFAGGTIVQDFGPLRCDGLGCASVEGECAAGLCNTATGRCELLPLAEGIACGEADACVDGGVCTNGSCTGIAVDCSLLDRQCVAGVCDPQSGLCSSMPIDEGSACDDGLACTVDDLCSAGACVGRDGCPIGEVCQGNGVCAITTFSTFRQGEGFGGTHDTSIYENAPDTPAGSADYFEWDSQSGSPPGQQIGLLRFDDVFGDDPGRILAGARVVSATLTLEVSDPSSGPAGDVHEVLVDWNEADATWNTFGDDPGVQTGDVGAFVTRAPRLTGSAELDVSRSLEAWSVDPTANRGWIFLPSSTNGVEVRSSEYGSVAERPLLTVEWLPPCTAHEDCDDGLACNGSEVCAVGRCQLGVPPDPAVLTDLIVSEPGPTALSWSDRGAGVTYDVAGLSLSALHADGSIAAATCLADDLAVNGWTDTRPDPPAQDAYLYLVRIQDACGAGPYAPASSGAARMALDDCPE